jgi:hypothetical protein
MKCSHGIQFEVKCRQCFEDAMKRVSASEVLPRPAVAKPEETEQWMILGDIHIGIDKNPRPL